MHFPQFAKN